MKRLVVTSVALLAMPLLCGFKFIEPPRAWHQDDLPMEYWVGDEEPDGLTESEKLSGIQASYDQWADVPCSPLTSEYGGEIDNDTSGFGRPDLNLFTFDGGSKDDLGSGPLAATITHANNDGVVSHNGQSFFRTTAMNIIYNEGLRWGAPEAIAAPGCHNTYDWVGVTTHEIGHGIGLGHSCDDGEPCPDPILRAATMYWSVSSCNDGQQVPGEDDWAGINAIYGVAVDFEIEGDGEAGLVGEVPLTVTLTVPDTFQGTQFTSYEWNFGDGTPHEVQDGTADLDPVIHRYDFEGQYTITLTVDGVDEECGGAFDADQRKVGVVLACEEPVPSFAWSNLGEFIVALENTSPLGAFGCITGFEWILDGDEANSQRTYEPTWSFDESGSHSVTLRASGPGGSADFTAEIVANKASDEGGCDCSAAGRRPAGFGVFLLLLVIGAVRRRLHEG